MSGETQVMMSASQRLGDALARFEQSIIERTNAITEAMAHVGYSTEAIRLYPRVSQAWAAYNAANSELYAAIKAHGEAFVLPAPVGSHANG